MSLQVLNANTNGTVPYDVRVLDTSPDTDSTLASKLYVDTLVADVAVDTTTASNVGASGEGIFKEKYGDDLQFFNLLTDSSIVLTKDPFFNTINLEVDKAVVGQGLDINDLFDVVIDAPDDKEMLIFDLASTKWINATADEANLVTLDTAQTITGKTIGGSTTTYLDFTDTHAIAVPSLAGVDTFLTESGSQDLHTKRIYNDNVIDTSLKFDNPAHTFQYSVEGSAITANRTAKIPVMTATDNFVMANTAQILTNKSIDRQNNTVTNVFNMRAATTVSTVNLDITSEIIVGATIGGHVCTLNQKVLLVGQTVKRDNGVYLVVASGASPRDAQLFAGTNASTQQFRVLFGDYINSLWNCTSAYNQDTTGTHDLYYVRVDRQFVDDEDTTYIDEVRDLQINPLRPDAQGYGWKDIIGNVNLRAGASGPSFNAYQGLQYAFQFDQVVDTLYFTYHMPHDYMPGTDIYFHVHWSSNVPADTGDASWLANYSYARGHSGGAFSTDKSSRVTETVNGTQYQHQIAEIIISSAGGSSTLLDNADFEPDGIFMVALQWNTGDVENTITSAPFIHFADLHYQTDRDSTENRSPPFIPI